MADFWGELSSYPEVNGSPAPTYRWAEDIGQGGELLRTELLDPVEGLAEKHKKIR